MSATTAAAGTTKQRAPRTRTGQRIAGRPKPIWDPLPVTEVAIGTGLLLAVIGYFRGVDDGAALIGAGVLFATGGVLELCVREHFSGFKSHTILLAFLPVVALHTVLRLWITDRYEGPVSVMSDVGVFALLSLALLDRYRRARTQEYR